MFFVNECFSDKGFYPDYLVYGTSFSSEACLYVWKKIVWFKEPCQS